MSRLQSIVPKLPSRDLNESKKFYTEKLGFTLASEYHEYLILKKDDVEIHIFLFPELNPKENYGMCYIRVKGINDLYEKILLEEVSMPEAGKLTHKPWGMKEFSIIDIDHNLLTFGEAVIL